MKKVNAKKRCMFNEAIKRQYIEYALSISASQKVDLFERGIANRFFRSEKFEAQIGKDIYEMNRAEAESFLKDSLCGGAMYQANTISTLRSYVEWAITNHHTTTSINSFDGIRVEDIDVSTSYVDTMVKDEADLIESLSAILADFDSGTADTAKWCLFLIMFAGMPFKDIFYVKKEDVSMENRKIKYGSMTVDISDNLHDALSIYFSMTELLKKGKHGSEYSEAIVDEGYLISNTKTYKDNRDKMKASCISDLSFIMKNCSKRLKPTSILDSGIFYRMSLKEEQAGEIDCREYLWARKNTAAVTNFPDRIKRTCSHEYETWKKAFNL